MLRLDKGLRISRLCSRNAIRSVAGFIFDIDGVLVRGGQVIPEAVSSFNKLYCQSTQKFRVPVVFATNAGNMLNTEKAKVLERHLNVPIRGEQVVMTQTPLSSLREEHEKMTLICGQGNSQSIANKLGFKNTITVDQLRDYLPYLDMCSVTLRPDDRNPQTYQENWSKFPRIEQLLLCSEPDHWDRNLQLIIDCLVTDGDFWRTRSHSDCETQGILGSAKEHIPILAANMDLQWVAEAPGPRFAHGMFLTCLEAAYTKLTGGKQIKYSCIAGKPYSMTYRYAEKQLESMLDNHQNLSDVYCIGDNLMSDIAGANIYKESQRKRAYHSVLVTTGVWTAPDSVKFALPSSPPDKVISRAEFMASKSYSVDHAPRDLAAKLKDESFLVPDLIFDHVESCIDYVFEKHKIAI